LCFFLVEDCFYNFADAWLKVVLMAAHVVGVLQSPVFLLFLDCVWQLLQQYPSRLAFTETFLTTMWDTMQLGITDTFLFNSAHQRKKFPCHLPPAWDWSLQFCEEDVVLFNNPLYSLNTTCDLEAVIKSAKGSLKREGSEGHSKLNTNHSYHRALSEYYSDSPLTMSKADLFKKPASDVLLPVLTSLASLELWTQCYLRWSVPAQILGGGPPAQYLRQCLLVEEVVCLNHKLSLLQEQLRTQRQAAEEGGGEGMVAERGQVTSPQRLPRPQSGLVFSLDKSQTQSALDSLHLTSSFPFPATVTAQTQHKLISGPLSIYLHDSLLQYDYADSED
jgi:myotubularin-related protein 10/11/12